MPSSATNSSVMNSSLLRIRQRSSSNTGILFFKACRHDSIQPPRSISSWTRIEVPAAAPRRGNHISHKADAALGVVARTTLQIQEQLTTPPGGALTKVDTTGRRIWPTAMPLLETILRQVDDDDSATEQQHKKPVVLELGAGCGLVGMGLAFCSGDRFERVILTDITTDWLERNVTHNQQQQKQQQKQKQTSSSSCCSIDVIALEWGKQQDHDFLHDCNSEHSLSFRILVDYIVGSDLLYNPSSHQALLTTLYDFATANKTKILLAYPRRSDNEAAFLALAEQRGFEVTISQLQGVKTQDDYQDGTRSQDGAYSLMTLVKR